MRVPDRCPETDFLSLRKLTKKKLINLCEDRAQMARRRADLLLEEQVRNAQLSNDLRIEHEENALQKKTIEALSLVCIKAFEPKTRNFVAMESETPKRK